MAARVQRPSVPERYVARVAAVLDRLPDVVREPAWTGVRWQVHGRTVAHIFGGEDQLFRITFRGEPDEVAAFQHLGPPYFRSGWGSDVIGLVVDDDTDWDEVGELVTDSYCIRAPTGLAALVSRPEAPPGPVARTDETL